MEPLIDPKVPESDAHDAPLAPATLPPGGPEAPYNDLQWFFIGPKGLRAGWSVLIFIALLIGLLFGLGTLFSWLHLISKGGFTPKTAIFSEVFQIIAHSVALRCVPDHTGQCPCARRVPARRRPASVRVAARGRGQIDSGLPARRQVVAPWSGPL